MRILHCGHMSTPMPGVVRQMQQEQEAADELGIGWDARLFIPAGFPGGTEVTVASSKAAAPRIPFKTDYYRWLAQQSDSYDAIMLRYSPYDPFQPALIRRTKKPVFLVFHTLYKQEIEMNGGLKSMARGYADALTMALSNQKAAGFIGVTQEIVQSLRNYSKPSFVYANGTSTSHVARDLRESGPPELLFIASTFAAWHGLDLLLDSISQSTAEFRLHLVGELDEAQARAAEGDGRVVAHGILQYEQLSDLYDRAWLSMSSFGLHRKGMKEAATLKVRESLSFGVPVYSGHRDVFPHQFPFYQAGPCSIDEILKYARQMREATREEVSSASKPFIDKRALLSGLSIWVQEQLRRT